MYIFAVTVAQKNDRPGHSDVRDGSAFGDRSFADLYDMSFL